MISWDGIRWCGMGMGRIITGERSTIELFASRYWREVRACMTETETEGEGSGTRVYFSCRGREE